MQHRRTTTRNRAHRGSRFRADVQKTDPPVVRTPPAPQPEVLPPILSGEPKVSQKIVEDPSIEEAREETIKWLKKRQIRVSQIADHKYIDRILARLNKPKFHLPHFPDTPAKLDAVLANPEPAIADIVQVVEQDPGLVQKVWAAATAHNGPEGVSDLSIAIAQLGLDALWTLGVQQGLSSASLSVPGFQEEIQRIREDGLLTAELAAWITGESRGALFVAARLSSIGHLILLQDAVPQDRLARPSPSLVKEILLRCARPISFLATHSWGLGQGIPQAIANAHRPAAAPKEWQPMAAITHCAIEAIQAGRSGSTDARLDHSLSMAPDVTNSPDSVLRRAAILCKR